MNIDPVDDSRQTFPPQRFTVWVAQTILLAASALGLFAWFNVHQDNLGLHGRSPVNIYALERYSKYLMSYRYVPEHFDGLLLSNSIGANWDTGQFRQHHVFNAGLRGSNISEEKAIVDRSLPGGHLKMAIIILLPSLTGSHGTRTAYMTPHDFDASFGSVQTLIIDAQAVMERHGAQLHLPASASTHKFDPDGAMNFPISRSPSDVVPPLAEAELRGDPAAVDEFKRMLAELHAHGVRVYGVFAPLYAPRWQTQGPELRSWQSQTSALFSPQDTVFDLNDGRLAQLEADRDSFPDYLHLSPAAASKVMADVVARIEQ